MNLNYLKTINAVKNNEVKMNTEFVESVKENLTKQSKSVELTIMNIDNMLGLKVQITNSGKEPFSQESGIDETFFDAVLNAVSGNMEALMAYDPAKHNVSTGEYYKEEILEDFLATQLPVKVKALEMSESSSIIEVIFQLGYRRKLRIYFSPNNMTATARLKEAQLIKEDEQ
jgi:hypothetical protein